MSMVQITKDGQTITINSALIAQHLALGWSIKQVSNALTNAAFTIGAEDTDVINIAVQLQDSQGAALAESMSLLAWLSDTANGLDVTATAPSGNVAIGTEGARVVLVAKKVFILNTNAAGLVDLNIEEAAGATWYLCLAFPNGERVVSGAITFAA